MNQQINIATELNDETFHFTRTSVYSFLQNNPWFDGKILYLTHSSRPISSQNLTIIQKLYSKIDLIKFENCEELSALEKQATAQYNAINTGLLKFSLLLQDEPVFYFKNCSLFTKDFGSILESKESLVDPSLNLIFFNENLKEFNYRDHTEPSTFIDAFKEYLIETEVKDFDTQDYTYSVDLPDKKFKQLFGLLNYSKVILFDFNNVECTKIQQIWLQKNKEALQYSNKPINVAKKNSIESSRSGKLELSLQNTQKINVASNYVNPLTQNMIESVNRINNTKVFEGALETFNYFKDKNICLIANSSQLLEYQHGDFIESHDIVIRFNGYKILPEHTGLRTDVHCVFRDYSKSSTDYIDYKIVFSSNVSSWFNAIMKYHAKDAVLRKYKLIDFNYPTYQQLSKAKCSGIKIPTSGVSAFVFLHSLGLAKNVKLFGFNGYNGGDSSSILRGNEDIALAKAHDYKLEAEYWSTQFTEILPGVLKYKHI